MSSKEILLPVTVRSETGKKVAKRLRASGQIPAIIYGRGSQSIPLQIDAATLKPLLDAPHVITLNFSDKRDNQYAVVAEVQRNCLSFDVLHVDFHEVKMGEEMHATLAIIAEGESKGVHDGGVLEQPIHEVEISCLPANLPEEIVVNISGLKIGDKISLLDLQLPEGVTLRDEADESMVVFAVVPPHVETAASDADAVTEPEVIGKGKEDESDDASAKS